MAGTQLFSLKYPVKFVIMQRLAKQIAAVAVNQCTAEAPRSLAASMTCCTIGFPARVCSTLGRSEYMRVPLPAARMTTLIVLFDIRILTVI
jgi:hypothetical protein